VGNDSDIELLAKIAAATKGEEQAAARESLAKLSGATIDQQIIAQIPNAETKTKAELIRSVGERNIINATCALLITATDPVRTVRQESYKALTVITNPEKIDDIIQLLIKEDNSGVRKEAEKTVVAVAQKIQDKNNQAKPVLNVLSSVEKIEAKSSLLEILGKIGDKNALPVLKETLNSKNNDIQVAAIRALSNWPDAEPINDLLNVAKTSADETQQILALRGYINLLKLENERSDEESIKLYLQGMALATELNEKRMVLSGLATLHSMQALETTAKYLDDPSLQPEAEVAIVGIVRNIENGDKDIIKEILNKVVKISKNTTLRERVENMLNSLK